MEAAMDNGKDSNSDETDQATSEATQESIGEAHHQQFDHKKETEMKNAIAHVNLAADLGHLQLSDHVEHHDADCEENSNWILLHNAAKVGDKDLLSQLANKVGVNIADGNGMTLLHQAAKDGQLDMIKLLLEHGANLGAKDANGMTPASYAAEAGHREIFEFLLIDKEYSQDIEINERDNNGMTILCHAAKSGNLFIIRDLIERGSNINVPDEQGNTPVSLLIQARKWDAAKYLIERGATVDNLTSDQMTDFLKGVNRSDLIIDKETEAKTRKVLYNTLCLNNAELFETLFRNWENLHSNNEEVSDITDDLLPKVYEELMLKRVPLSKEVQFVTEYKIFNSRLFMERNEETTKEIKASLNGVQTRIDMVCSIIEQLLELYSGIDESDIDNRFILISRFIDQNIHILKRQLRSTYNKLPWEEIEFYLVIYITVRTKAVNLIYIYKLFIDKEKLLYHLTHFGKALNKIKLESTDINSTFPKHDGHTLSRSDAKKSIISSNPLFQDLYDDFEMAKNVYSLNRIQSYIKLAMSVDLKENQELGKLVIERVLQVLGESLKNTLESPNVSDEVHRILLSSAPRDTKEIVTLLRDSLSRSYTLSRKIEFEECLDAVGFSKIINDLSKLNAEINKLICYEKSKAITKLLKNIIECKNLKELKKFGDIDVESLITDNDREKQKIFDTTELKKTKALIEKLDCKIENKSELEKCLFNKISEIIYEQENRLVNAASQYELGVSTVISVIFRIRQSVNLENIQTQYQTILKILQESNEQKNLKDIFKLIDEIFNIERKKGRNKKPIILLNQLYDQIRSSVEYAEIVDGIYEFKKHLETYTIEQAISELKWLFSELENTIEDTIKREAFTTAIHKQQEISYAKAKLCTHFAELDNGTTDVANVKQTFDECIKILEIKKAKKDELSHHLSNSKWNECKQLVSNIRNSYDTLINSVYKSINSNKPYESSKVLKDFLKSVGFHEDTENTLDALSIKKRMQLNVYLNNRLVILEKYVNWYGNDLKFLKAFLQDKLLQSAIEMLVLDIYEIFKNDSLFGDNTLFLDFYSSVLIGKNLRNYLAHGDAIINSLLIDPSISIAITALQLIRKGKEFFIKGDMLIGQRLEENVFNLFRRHLLSTSIVNSQRMLFDAVLKGDIQKIIYSLYGEADINGRNINGWTGLHYAASADKLTNFRYLLYRNINTSIEDNSSFNYLQTAASSGSNNIIVDFMERGYINTTNIVNRKLLYVAAHIRDHEVIESILDKCDYTNNLTFGNCSLLHMAVVSGNEIAVKTMLEKGADVDVLKAEKLTPLHMAILSDHTTIVAILLDNGADANSLDSKSVTPLSYAGRQGNCDIAKLLLEKGANVNGTNQDTPLHSAAFGGHLDIVNLLLANNATIDAPDEYGYTPLFAAAANGHQEVIKTLLEHGANASAIAEYNYMPLHGAVLYDQNDAVNELLSNSFDGIHAHDVLPLHLAAFRGNLDLVEALLTEGSNINALTDNNETVLHFAVEGGHIHLTSVLLSRGQNVNAQNKDNYTPLHFAAKNGHHDLVALLSDEGANVMGKTIDKMTPLHLAVQNGHHNVIDLLVEKGANVDAEGIYKVRPLHCAAQNGHLESVQELLRKSAIVDVLDEAGRTPLHCAATSGHKHVLKVLLSNKANVNAQTNDKWTPLHFATKSGHQIVVEMLLANGASVNVSEHDSLAPLHIAAYNDQDNMVKILLCSGANINALGDSKLTPLHMAVIQGHNNVAKLLLESGADVDSPNVDGNTPLHYAVKLGKTDIVLALLKKCHKVDAPDKNNSTSLHIAAKNGLQDVVTALLEKGANVDALDKFNRTPLFWAAGQGHHDIVNVLLEKTNIVDVLDENMATPLHFAAKNGHQDVVTALLAKGANVDALDKLNKTALYWAANKGHHFIANVLLERGSDFLARNNHDTILHQAVAGNNQEILKLILNKISDYFKQDSLIMNEYINAQDREGDTPLMWAAEKGKTSTAKLLLDYGAGIDAQNNEGMTALHWATGICCLEFVQLLIHNNANANTKDASGRTPLFLAQELMSRETKNRENAETIIGLLMSVTDS